MTANFILVLSNYHLKLYTFENKLWLDLDQTIFMHRFHPECMNWKGSGSSDYYGSIDYLHKIPGSNIVLLTAKFYQQSGKILTRLEQQQEGPSPSILLRLKPGSNRDDRWSDLDWCYGYFLFDLQHEEILAEYFFDQKHYRNLEETYGSERISIDEYGLVYIHTCRKNEILQVSLFPELSEKGYRKDNRELSSLSFLLRNDLAED